jgi:hypothetical protein
MSARSRRLVVGPDGSFVPVQRVLDRVGVAARELAGILERVRVDVGVVADVVGELAQPGLVTGALESLEVRLEDLDGRVDLRGARR